MCHMLIESNTSGIGFPIGIPHDDSVGEGQGDIAEVRLSFRSRALIAASLSATAHSPL
jgi:hypothetical protein